MVNPKGWVWASQRATLCCLYNASIQDFEVILFRELSKNSNEITGYFPRFTQHGGNYEELQSMEAEEIAQWVTCLSQKPDNPSLESQKPWQSQAHLIPIIAVLLWGGGRGEWENSP